MYCPDAGKVVYFTQDELRNSDSYELREAQGNDSCLSKVRLAVSQKQLSGSVQLDHVDLKALKKKWKSLEVDQGLLYQVLERKNNQRYFCFPLLSAVLFWSLCMTKMDI